MTSSRRAKGINLIGLIKLLKGLRKKRPLLTGGLSPQAMAFLEEQRVLVSDWYPFEVYLELMHLVFTEVLERSEEGSREMGIMGGRIAFASHHKLYVAQGNPLETLLALRHSWRAYYDFGTLSAVAETPRTVRITVDGYPDMDANHGNMIVGWHVAAAREAGAEGAQGELMKAPWRGDQRLVHRIAF